MYVNLIQSFEYYLVELISGTSKKRGEQHVPGKKASH